MKGLTTCSMSRECSVRSVRWSGQQSVQEAVARQGAVADSTTSHAVGAPSTSPRTREGRHTSKAAPCARDSGWPACQTQLARWSHRSSPAPCLHGRQRRSCEPHAAASRSPGSLTQLSGRGCHWLTDTAHASTMQTAGLHEASLLSPAVVQSLLWLMAAGCSAGLTSQIKYDRDGAHRIPLRIYSLYASVQRITDEPLALIHITLCREVLRCNDVHAGPASLVYALDEHLSRCQLVPDLRLRSHRSAARRGCACCMYGRPS